MLPYRVVTEDFKRCCHDGAMADAKAIGDAGVSATVAVAVTGASYRQIDWWARQGIVVPVVAASGSGSRRCYSRDDLVKLAAAVRMREAGLALDAVSEALAEVDDDTEQLRIVAGGCVEVHVDLVAVRAQVDAEVAAVTDEDDAEVEARRQVVAA